MLKGADNLDNSYNFQAKKSKIARQFLHVGRLFSKVFLVLFTSLVAVVDLFPHSLKIVEKKIDCRQNG